MKTMARPPGFRPVPSWWRAAATGSPAASCHG